jgi:hypothetical protein
MREIIGGTFDPETLVILETASPSSAQKDVSHGPEPGKPHSRTRL